MVDVVFIELATKAEYKTHGKDHLLPIDPAEVLSECEGCDIELLKQGMRPLYVLKRKQLCLPFGVVSANIVTFSDNIRAEVSRKYYHSASSFLKVYRFNEAQTPAIFHTEVEGLLKVRDLDIAPRLLDWAVDSSAGLLLMERLYGPSLKESISCFQREDKLRAVVAESIRVASLLSEAQIYQNDFSAHNIILCSDGKLRIIDFEQACNYPIQDHFALFLWLVNDLHKGSLESYKRSIYGKLRVRSEPFRTPREFYPDLSSLKEDPFLGKIVTDAEQTEDTWHQYTKRWAQQLSGNKQNHSILKTA
jgi:predicted Ser/Thr protein kinase